MNKFLVITGANYGIGFATAELFSNNNYCVINISRYKPTQEDAIHLKADFSNPDWINLQGEQLSKLLSHAQSICLVHNSEAVLTDDHATRSNKLHTPQSLYANVIASTQLNHLIFPLMKPGSSVLYIDPPGEYSNEPCKHSYEASRQAQIGLMKATCQDLITQGIHTACVCPEPTNQYDSKEILNTVGGSLELVAEQTSLKHITIPSQFAKTVQYCAETPAINGAIIRSIPGSQGN